MPHRLATACATFALATACVGGRSTESEHLKVQLVSDTDSVEPGRPLWVGLHFEMEKEWHIYWRNPGDSGEPPRIRWNLPAGFRAGAIQWPAPARLGSGSVIDYGYEEPVLLPVEIQVPKTLRPGDSVMLSAGVSWLVCKDICVPGKAVLTLSLPVRATPGSASGSHALFQAAKFQAPKPIPSTWRVEVVSDKDRFVLTIEGGNLAKVSFFPLEADQIDNAAPQVAAALPGGMRLTLKKSEQLLHTPATLDGVLEVGLGQAYGMSVPVQSPH